MNKIAHRVLDIVLYPIGVVVIALLLFGFAQHRQAYFYLPFARLEDTWRDWVNPYVYFIALGLGWVLGGLITFMWRRIGPGAIARRQQEKLRNLPPRPGEYD